MSSAPALSKLYTTSMKIAQQLESDKQTYNLELHKRFMRMKETGISLRKLAPMLRRSYTSLSQYMNFRYEGNLKALEHDIRILLERKEGHRTKVKGQRFCRISASEVIWEVLQTCHENGEMGAEISPSGTSKTYTAHEYQEKHPSTVLITASPTCRAFSAILRALANKVGGANSNMALDDVMWRIIDKLKGSRRLVIVDESHFLKFESFEVIRTIFDATGVGFTYLGTPRLYSQMRGDTRYDWDQILSRITIRRSVSEINYEDVKTVTDTICPGLAKSSIDFLYRVAQEPGKLRTMTSLLKRAVEFHEMDGIKITVDLLKEFKQMRDF